MTRRQQSQQSLLTERKQIQPVTNMNEESQIKSQKINHNRMKPFRH